MFVQFYRIVTHIFRGLKYDLLISLFSCFVSLSLIVGTNNGNVNLLMQNNRHHYFFESMV